jgi:glycerol uptake facilitator-like aquaporin
MFSDSFAGIAPNSAPGFIVAQIIGALVGLALIVVLYPDTARRADDVVVPHPSPSRRCRPKEFVMTDTPVTHHLRRDLSIDQQLALRTAATRL